MEYYGHYRVNLAKVMPPGVGWIRVFNHPSGCALGMIKNPNPPSSLGITDFGFNIPWASVLLVLKGR